MESIKIKDKHLLLLTAGIITISLIACVKPVDTGGGSGSGSGSGSGNGSGSALAQRMIMDTSYGTDPLQKMDIYLPAGRTSGTKLVIFIHGGGWESGSKSDGGYLQLTNLLRQKWPEAAVASINYRLTANPSIHHTEIMTDVTSAVNFLLNHKANFVISDTLLMMGASAGAHLATLYTYKFNTNNKVRAVADFFGPVKLDDWDWYNSFNIWVGKPVKDVLTAYNGATWNVALYQSNSPYSQVTATSKPTIIFHGTLDAIVPIYQSQWFKGKLNTLGVPFAYYEYLDGHGFNYTNDADAVTKTVAFFKAHLN